MIARSLKAVLDSSAELAHTSTHVRRLMALQRTFAAVAPDYLTSASRVANYYSGRIIIHADNGAVAAKLRHLVPRLYSEFVKNCAEVTEVRIRVQAPSQSSPRKSATRRILADGTRASLSELAGSLPAEAALRRALRKLLDRN